MNLIPSTLTDYTLESYLIRITTTSRIIYWIIIGTILISFALLPFIYVDVTVQARGFFQSDIEKQLVYTPFQGKVIHAPVKNGDRISRGDTLLIIDSEAVRSRHQAVMEQMSENEASINDLQFLVLIDSTDLTTSNATLTTARYLAEYRNIRNQYLIQLQKFNKRLSEHERNILLFRQQIIPLTDFENSLFSLQSESENLNQILLHQKSIWQNDLASRKNNAVSLLAEIEQCREELTNRVVLAPSGGAVIQSTDIQIGSVVSPGQKIAEISPDGELLATCFVRPSDIGFIHDNQKVKIQVDAFNHNEWGMLQGEIVDISDDMIVENGSISCFRIRCKPEKTFLSLKNGYRAEIKKGMSVNTRIFVIRRSLFNLLFDKADKWFNPYTYNKES
jgi:multidrug resistance efflux pump